MSPYYADDAVTLWHGDALAVLSALPDASVNCCVTSPPYFGLRDYGVAATDWPEVAYAPMMGMPPAVIPPMTCVLGMEPDPASFVGHLRLLFDQVRRVLADDGTLWLVLGDSYYSGRGAATGIDRKNVARRGFGRVLDKGGCGWARPKNLLGIPWRAAFALQDSGWNLRSDIAWAKPDPTPENVKDRPTASHEHIFLFSKSRRYYFDADAIAETATGQASGNGYARPASIARGGPGQTGQWEGRPQLRRALELATKHGLSEEHFVAIRAVGMSDAGKARAQQGAGRNTAEHERLAAEAKAVLGGYYREFLTGATKNARDVWTIASQPFPEAHFATFPPALPERAILAGCKPGGTVLDPFSGSGTTGLAANKHGRRYVGIDLSAAYLDLSLRTRFAQPGLDLSDGATA